MLAQKKDVPVPSAPRRTWPDIKPLDIRKNFSRSASTATRGCDQTTLNDTSNRSMEKGRRARQPRDPGDHDECVPEPESEYQHLAIRNSLENAGVEIGIGLHGIPSKVRSGIRTSGLNLILSSSRLSILVP